MPHTPPSSGATAALASSGVDDDELAAEGLRQRVASEDALGQLARELLENPLVTRALTRAFEAREKAALDAGGGVTALNIPSG